MASRSKAIMTAMIAMTTRSSVSVKPRGLYDTARPTLGNRLGKPGFSTGTHYSPLRGERAATIHKSSLDCFVPPITITQLYAIGEMVYRMIDNDPAVPPARPDLPPRSARVS
jgi:hypothetical protein